METFKINMNEELNGVELTFSQKPDTRILTTLKDAGFRWHRVQKDQKRHYKSLPN